MAEEPVAAGSVQRTIVITLVVCGVAMAGVALVMWRDLILLLFAGIVIATALHSACEFVGRRLGLAHSTATILVYTTLSLTLIGLSAWLLPQIWNQGFEFWAQLPAWYSDSREWLLASSSRTLQRLGDWLPKQMPTIPLASLQDSSDANGSWGIVGYVAWIIVGVLSVGILAFYWTVNRQSTIRSLLQLLPEHRREFYSDLIDTLFMKLGDYVRGQLILCAIVGAFSLVAYWLIGLPYSLVLALVAGLLEAIPVFGPTLGAVPAVIVGLSVGPQTTMMVIAAAMLIQTLENYLFVPKVMDRSVGISAVVTLMALVAFGALFGLLGAVLAIPLAAIVQTLFDKLVLQADFKEAEVEVSRDLSGVMRYQLLDLIQDVKRQQRHKDSDIEHSTTAAFNEIESLATALDELIQRESNAEDLSESPPVIARSA